MCDCSVLTANLCFIEKTIVSCDVRIQNLEHLSDYIIVNLVRTGLKSLQGKIVSDLLRCHVKQSKEKKQRDAQSMALVIVVVVVVIAMAMVIEGAKIGLLFVKVIIDGL